MDKYKILLVSIVSMSCGVLLAQPSIVSMDKSTGSMQQVVTFKGNGFGNDPTKISVSFGAMRADVVSVSDQLLEARIPAGSTYSEVSVANLNNGLIGYSPNQFLLSFGGPGGFDINNLEGQFNFPPTAPATEGLYDLCMCDFDNDKKIDIATANFNYAFIVVYSNTSTGPGNLSFARRVFNASAVTLQLKCADLNGDGRPDIVATEKEDDKIFFFRNTSTGPGNFGFSLPQNVALPGKINKQLEIADLDLDGLPEVIVSTQGGNTISVLKNGSTLAALSFPGVETVTIPEVPAAASAGLDGLAAKDLNGDRLPDIVTSQFQTNTDLYVIRNNSTPGNINLSYTSKISIGTAIKNIRLGDIDNDGKNDIAFTQILPSSTVNVVLNQTSGNSFSFASVKSFATDGLPWGLDIGDLDGDGKGEIVVSSFTKKSLTILNNFSVPGTLNMQTFVKGSLTYVGRHVLIGDVDGDGKPDIAYTSIDDDNLGVPASKVSIFRNKTCMVPAVTPEGPINVCAGTAVNLEATFGRGVTYIWSNATAGSEEAGTYQYVPTVSGEYQVSAESENGNCKTASNIVKVSIGAGTSGEVLPVNNGPVCKGSTLTLKISNDQGNGYTYNWKGPEGFAATGASVNLPNVTLLNAGEYEVSVVTPSGCVARVEKTIVEIIDVPDFKVGFSGSEVICKGTGELKALSIFPNSPNFTYQWFEVSAGSLGVTAPGYNAGNTGEYYVKATSIVPGCAEVQSTSAKIIAAIPPTPAFEIPAEACKGQEIRINNTTESDPLAETFYFWSFGDATSSTERSPAKIYASTGTKNIVYQVSYSSNKCQRTINKSIEIKDAPTLTVVNPDNLYDVCPGGSLVLEAQGGPFNGYVWNTGETTSSITVSAGGEYFVEASTQVGCVLKSARIVGEFARAQVDVSADPPVIEEGASSQLLASGLQSYTWTPQDVLNDPSIPNPVATLLTSTTFTVSGPDINGCEASGTIAVQVKGNAIVSKLTPGNFFSPNGDEVQPFWTVQDIDLYPQCGVVVYDDKGVKVFDSKPYLNNWDGTFNGKKLPDGVYYFVIRCDGEENVPRMGSVSILR